MSCRSLAALVALTAVVVLAPLAAGAQSAASSPARTPWGHPDLQGVWSNNAATPLERPEAFAGKATLTDEELAQLKRKAAQVLNGDDAFFGDDFITAVLSDPQHRSFDTQTGNYNQFWLVDRHFENRTSLIIDPPSGKLPPLTAQGKRRAAEDVDVLFTNKRPETPADLSLPVRCITFGLPNIFAGYNSNFQVLQTPTHVALYHELMHDVRIIPLDGGPHVPGAIRQWHGDARGRWEGETLVVETRNYSAQTRLTIPGAGAGGDRLDIVERFTRVGPDTMQWDITFSDPTVWTRSWTARIFLQRSDQPIYEYACHEGNYAIVGILAGARLEEEGSAGSRGSR